MSDELSREASEQTEVSTHSRADVPASVPVAAATLDSPRIGRYVLLRKLGQGGMGVVYAGYDETLDRKVAIKLLRYRTGDAAQRRLAREAQALARLSDPHVVQVYEIGKHGDASYIAMEYVEGQTLGAWARAAPRHWSEILPLMIDAGRGLAAAHRKGLVHRDFKPENVMLDDEGRVRVMDFGLVHGALDSDTREHDLDPEHDPREAAPALLDLDALALGETSNRETASRRRPASELSDPLTKTGSTLGTPAYMPPEQHAGRTTDARSDQFSYCVALWELLHRQRPFAGRNLGELYLAVSHHQVSEPPRDADVPSWLRKVIERGLQPDPDARWQDMDELLAALSDDPRRRRGFLLGLGAVLVLALAAIGLRSVMLEHGRERAEAACVAEGAAIEQLWSPSRADTLARGFGSGARSMADSWTHTRKLLDAYAREWSELRTATCRAAQVDHTRTPASAQRTVACLDEARAALAATLDVLTDPSIELAAHAPRLPHELPRLSACTDEASLARRVHQAGDGDELTELRAELQRATARALGSDRTAALTMAMRVAERAAAEQRPTLAAEAALLLGDLHEAAADYAAAQRDYEQAFLLAGRADTDELALRAATRLTRLVGVTLGKLELGRVWARVAEMLLARLDRLEAASDDAAAHWSAVGALEQLAGRHELALAACERALTLYEQALGSQHPDVATALLQLAALHGSREQFDQAQALIERALDLRRRAYGPEHPDVATAIAVLGGLSSQRGLFDDARVQLQRAADIRELTLGPEHPDFASSLLAIGMLDSRQGQPAAALSRLERALAIREAALGPEHPAVAEVLGELAVAHMRLGQLERAIDLMQRAVDLTERAFGPEHPQVARALINLAQLVVERDAFDAAEAAILRARTIFTASYGPEHSDVANAIEGHGTVLEARGDVRAARAEYERALALYERSLGPEHYELSTTLFLIGEASRVLGEYDRARPALERSLALELRAGVGGVRTAETRVALADVYWTLGEHEQARTQARAAIDDLRAIDAEPNTVAAIEAWLANEASSPR